MIPLRLLPVLLSSLAVWTQAHAQPYPTRPVRMVIPLPPGGVTDAMGRLLAQKFSESWGQPVVPDNRPGGAGIIAAEAVARATPDGHTLLLGNINTHGINPSLYPRMPYDPVRDFAPVTLLVSVPNLLLVHPALPAKNVQELIALGRAKPGTLNASSPGNGTSGHMGVAVFVSMTGVKITHVPYKGPAPALQAVMGGETQMVFDTIFQALPHARAGRVKALGLSVPQRSALAPEIPTIAEQGLPDFNVSPWFALFATAGTPPATIRKLHAETVTVMEKPDVSERLQSQGLKIELGTPAALAGYVKSEIARWNKVVREAGIKVE
ncbi:MAG TPA: tripartite tricarboxylate transporter substrate binding protein [Burkholderiales bacterium]|nr:tripartite tricarboxylate transporter substrate binding protein [Burkholderiales bacterium]